MSLHYTCRIYLEASCDEAVFFKLLQKGKTLGFIYFYRESYSDDFDVAKNMSAKEALNFVEMGRTSRKDDFDFPKSLAIQYQETVFTLYFPEEDKGMYVSFFILENPWKKQCGSLELIDFGRYVKLWIDMCEDFCIYKIETSID